MRRECTTVKEYVDKGISGAKERRPALDNLLADCRRRAVDCVVVYRYLLSHACGRSRKYSHSADLPTTHAASSFGGPYPALGRRSVFEGCSTSECAIGETSLSTLICFSLKPRLTGRSFGEHRQSDIDP